MPIPESAGNEPVEYLEMDADKSVSEEGIALCLSGGGYRAMLFHTGSLWRLYDSGVLQRISQVSSVSGGSITACVLGLAWKKLFENPGSGIDSFAANVVRPIRLLASKTIDIPAVLRGLFFPGRISKRIESYYRKYLYGDVTLKDLPGLPKFVINATNVQSGVLWRFSRKKAGDYRVWEINNPDIRISVAVGASSAFPPFLSPVILKFDSSQYRKGSGKDLQYEPFMTRVLLSDGGVYDNMGLETAWKRNKTVLVSDAGGKMEAQKKPGKNWLSHSYRILGIIDNQVRSLRIRQLMDAYNRELRKGAYWGIRTDISHYELNDSMDCPHDRTMILANTPTRLKRLPEERQKRLINWGYAVCDAALRRHFDPGLKKAEGFPYPDAEV